MIHLFRPNKNTQMTFRRIISLLKPNFAEDGSNKGLYQNKVYTIFMKYLREAVSKYFVVVVVVVLVLLLMCLWPVFSFYTL